MRRCKPPAHTVELDHPTAAAWSFQEAAAPCLVCFMHHGLLGFRISIPLGSCVCHTSAPGALLSLLPILLDSGQHEQCVCGGKRASPV